MVTRLSDMTMVINQAIRHDNGNQPGYGNQLARTSSSCWMFGRLLQVEEQRPSWGMVACAAVMGAVGAVWVAKAVGRARRALQEAA